MPKKADAVSFSLSLLIILSGCVAPGVETQGGSGMRQVGDIFDSPNPCSNNNRNIGAGLGALTGLAAATLFHQKVPVVLGATVAGAGLGALIGHGIDERRCNLYRIAEANSFRVATAPITDEKLGLQRSQTEVGLDVQLMKGDHEFEAGTAFLTPQSRQYFGQVAEQYKPVSSLPGSDNRNVLIIDHSDEGDHATSLSQQRAHAVASLFAKAGVPAKNIYYQGAGNSLPLADNESAVGRSENRRIEIVDVPSTTDLNAYLQLRSPNPANFAAAHTPPPASATPQTTSSPPSTKARLEPAHPPTPHSLFSKESGYDFGGVPVQPAGIAINIGQPTTRSMFTVIEAASAATPLSIDSCLRDTPHVAGEVRNLATGNELAPRYYLPGFDSAVWTGNANGNLIAVLGATVPNDAAAPIPSPKLLIYKNYAGDKHQKPNFSKTVQVNVYRGSQSTLYRLFVNGAADCIDLIVPPKAFSGDSHVYYSRNAVEQVASPSFTKR